MARLPDAVETLEGEEKRIYEEMRARRPCIPGPYVPLMHHPRLAQHVEKLGYYLKFESKLPRDVYEFIVLAVARTYRVPYIWKDHIGPARAAGLTDGDVRAIAQRDASLLEPRLAVVAGALEYILGFQSLPEELQNEVIAHHGRKGLVEIVVLCGFYQTMGVINQSFDVPHDSPEAPPF